LRRSGQLPIRRAWREDLRALEPQIGCRLEDHLPLAKSGYRLDRRPARHVLSAAPKELIYRSCRAEFDLLGYDR
jgi:hypothetical protein